MGVNSFQIENVKICVIMVGLPARGKSLIAQKIVRYITWLSIAAKCFNVGNYRRLETAHPTAEFFDVNNVEGERLRRVAAEAAISDMFNWFETQKGVVGILDATNSTKKRRDWILEICRKRNVEPMFVESWCDDEELIMQNIIDVKTTSPDYVGQDPEQAAQDFRTRIRNYEQVYETISDRDLTYVKLINVGSQVIINRIQSYLESRIVYYLMNLHIKPRCIWLSRHGESQFNVHGQIGGDSDLSARGREYSRQLPRLTKMSVGDRPLTVWTSTLKRTQQTAKYLPYRQLTWKALDELDAGQCDGLTYEDIESRYPDDFAARDENKYEYRYPGGESYRDVVIRLEPIIMELERQENIMIVTHQAVLRCIYAYFMNVPQDQSPWMEVPLHTLIKLEPKAYGTEVTRIKADIPAVSTYREKGQSTRRSDVGPNVYKK
ncbi:6-phosphofructo-2-kinase-domain-containing protein [Lipomyces arxii]|uniref:6-phosphofructo-2-kinase-domain-containing protein n=1 Tax=Lipomyces arxii TaxID=56418 RepID=UPI0034D002A8